VAAESFGGTAEEELRPSGMGVMGVAGVTGVTGAAGRVSLSLSRFLASDLRKALTVERRLLLGLQSWGVMGACAHMGHASTTSDWPREHIRQLRAS